MSSKSSNFGCVLLVIIIALFSFGSFLITTPIGWLLIVGAVAVIVLTKKSRRDSDQAQLTAALQDAASTMDEIAAGKVAETGIGVALHKDEKLIYALPNVALTEYQSTGSSYSGGSVGISFPLVGRIRGNVGGQGGQIIKNPEQLMIVDTGKAIFTDKRILFSGTKLVRDWEFSKIVELAPGPNGFDVKLAVSNREKISGLQALTMFEFGPGYVAGYAFTLYADGPAEAKAWAEDLSKRIREGIAAEAK